MTPDGPPASPPLAVSVLPICAVPLIVGAEFTYWADANDGHAKSAAAATRTA